MVEGNNGRVEREEGRLGRGRGIGDGETGGA